MALKAVISEAWLIVGEESYRNTLALRSLFFVAFGEAAQLDFGLHRRIALQTGYGHQVHVVESQLAEFRHLRLDEERRLRGIQSAREIVEGDLEDVLPHFFRVVRIIGQRLASAIMMNIFSNSPEFCNSTRRRSEPT